MPLQHSLDRFTVDPGFTGGLADMPSVALQQLGEEAAFKRLDHVLFRLLERAGRRIMIAAVMALYAFRPVSRRDSRAIRQRGGAFNHVLKLPDVAGPGITAQHGQCFLIEDGMRSVASTVSL